MDPGGGLAIALGGVAMTGANPGASGVPHDWQNWFPSGFCVPQLPQATAISSPHFETCGST